VYVRAGRRRKRRGGTKRTHELIHPHAGVMVLVEEEQEEKEEEVVVVVVVETYTSVRTRAHNHSHTHTRMHTNMKRTYISLAASVQVHQPSSIS
jgi:hypothetical protein